MKIILEEKDIIELLGKALGTTLDPTNVHITTNPFEIVVMEAAKVFVQKPKEAEKDDTVKYEIREEMTPEDAAELMGVSAEIVQIGIPSASPNSTIHRPTTTPPPTKNGKEV